MWHLILFALCLVVLTVVVSKITRKKPPDATYVCDVCGRKDCICHKEQEGTGNDEVSGP